MNEDWSNQEVALIVEDYFSMLLMEMEGRSFVKKQHRSRLLPQLDQRSEGSIEFKHQNISAVLNRLGEPHIKGYKPLPNYQQLLEDQVIKALQKYEAQLNPLFEKYAEEPVAASPFSKQDFATCLEDRPSKSKLKPRETSFRAVKVNYLEKEQKNRVLGAEGERFAIDYEKWRLTHAGRKDLIKEIKWISKEKGDGAGYDILSKNEDGTDRYIEVKTTKLSKETPIYFTFNEYIFAERHAAQFYLYRVFNFDSDRKLFILQGHYGDYCEVVPMAYKGIF
jgi:hypothetical protein